MHVIIGCLKHIADLNWSDNVELNTCYFRDGTLWIRYSLYLYTSPNLKSLCNSLWNLWKPLRVLVTSHVLCINTGHERNHSGRCDAYSTVVLQHRSSLNQPAPQCLLSFFPTMFTQLQFSLLHSPLPSPHSLFSGNVFFSLLYLSVLVASHCRLLLLGPLSLFKEPPATCCICARFH